MAELFAAIEAGGTKCIAALGIWGQKPVKRIRIPTSSPIQTISEILGFFAEAKKEGLAPLALGIGTFGPAVVNPSSVNWGHIGSTPKPGWSGTDFAGILAQKLRIPVGFDTDVNTAALAEETEAMRQGMPCDPLLYLTIGTGIGGGLMTAGNILHGLSHPEMGHMRLARHPDDQYEGNCPYHRDCWEGLAAGPAIEDRWKTRGEQLSSEHAAWDLEAWYIAQGVANLAMVVSPQRIVLGGGIMDVKGLRERVAIYTATFSKGYLSGLESPSDWASILVPPLVEEPGLAGAFLLAAKALQPKAKVS